MDREIEPCRCNCYAAGKTDCDHKWDGKWWEREDGRMGSVTCSVCGMLAIEHDTWLS